MSLDEMKQLLMSGEEEGADRGSIYDAVLSEVESMTGRLAEAEGKVAELTAKTAELAENNLKLLDKIRYSEKVVEDVIEEEQPEITIDNLFEEV